MSARLNRRGATLILVMLVTAFMGVSVAITYARLSSERRITSDTQAQMDAYTVAQSGLSRYLAGLNGKPGWTDEATFNDLPGGTAQVTLRMLRDSTSTLLPAVYVLSSRGVNTTAKRYSGSAPAAERTVATYARWTPAPFDLDGAFTSLAEPGLRINGSAPRLSGIDRCGSAPPIPGVATPNALYSGDPVVIEGNPMNTAVDIGTPGSGGTAQDEVDIDWAGITASTVLPPNFTYPAWPTTDEFAHWPIVKVNGDLSPLPTSGKGILIVTGNLVINGSNPQKLWEGLVLVGGTLTGNGASQINGAVITGLNVKLGMSVPLNDLGNGTKIYQYDSCALTRALGKIGSLQRVRNGWTDTWPSY